MTSVTKPARFRLWGSIALAFAAASMVQILMYARSLWSGEPVWGRGSPLGGAADYLYTPLVLLFFFGPGIVASMIALRILYRTYGAEGHAPPLLAVLAIVLMTIVSCYLGVFVSFNTWGT